MRTEADRAQKKAVPRSSVEDSWRNVYGREVEVSPPLTHRRRVEAPARHWGTFWRVCAREPMTLHLRESTIHEQFDSRDVGAIVGCQKHDGFSSLIGRSEPTERNALGDRLFAFLAYL
jgi:hypothetical protein